MTDRTDAWNDGPPPADWCLDGVDAHVWRIALDRTDCDWDAPCGTLSPEEQQRAACYKRAVDRDRFARTRGVLRLLLARYCDVAPQRLEWLVSPEGKPRLDPASGACQVQFNVSHSGDIALVAISRRSVGVDVEQMRPDVACLAIAQRYFSPREAAELQSLAEGELVPAFYRCWTRKEAFVKATGKGISSGLAAFSVSLRPNVAPQIVEANSADAHRWQLFDLAPAKGYAASLAVEGATGAGILCGAWKA